MFFFWPIFQSHDNPIRYRRAHWLKKERTSVTAWDFSQGPSPTEVYWEDVEPRSRTYCTITKTPPYVGA